MFSGAFTALVTPFKNGEVDVEAVESLVEFQIEGGIDGLVPCGTPGESPTLSEEEDRLVIETVVRVPAGRVPVVAGTGSNNTASAIKYTKMAAEVGADGSLQVAPYYNKPPQEGLFRHYTAIAENTALPLVLYNIPGRTNVTIAPETIAQLAEIPNIVGVKESTLSMNMVSDKAPLRRGVRHTLRGRPDDAPTARLGRNGRGLGRLEHRSWRGLRYGSRRELRRPRARPRAPLQAPPAYQGALRGDQSHTHQGRCLPPRALLGRVAPPPRSDVRREPAQPADRYGRERHPPAYPR